MGNWRGWGILVSASVGLILGENWFLTPALHPSPDLAPSSAHLFHSTSEPNHAVEERAVTKWDKCYSNGIGADFSTWHCTTTHHLSCPSQGKVQNTGCSELEEAPRDHRGQLFSESPRQGSNPLPWCYQNLSQSQLGSFLPE